MSSTDDTGRFWRNPDHLAYHTRQFDQVYRSTVFLLEFLSETLRRPGGEAIDVGCGAGANIFHVARKFPAYRWTGVDVAGDVTFPVGRPHFEKAGLPVELLTGNFNTLSEVVGGRKFDLVLCLQTLLSIRRYERALDQLLSVTRGWLVVSSLFSEFNVDVFANAVDYSRPVDAQRGWYYNTYSLQRFRELCRQRGAREILDRPFEIDIDLPAPEAGGLSTYTMKRDTGARLQFSGPIYQPWRVVAVRMGEA